MDAGRSKRKHWTLPIQVFKGVFDYLLPSKHVPFLVISPWYSEQAHIRVCFLDFSKAFDSIGYILIDKLIDLGVRRSLIPWIISFLTGRRQQVKIGISISNWLPVTAGVLQETKLGPILFLVLVNNLKPSAPDTRMWKFVDDSTIFEHLTGNSVSVTQLTLNHVESWSSNNWIILNPKKCKELRICFFKGTFELQP